MSKNFFSGAVISTGPTLPAIGTVPDGALFMKTGAGAGLYFYGFKPDIDVGNFGEQGGSEWTLISDTGSVAGSGFVLKSGDTVTGPLNVVYSPSPGLVLNSGTPGIRLSENDRGLDGKEWFVGAQDGVFQVQARSDSYATAVTEFSVNRSGSAFVRGNQVWHAGNLSSLSQLANDIGAAAPTQANPLTAIFGGTGASNVFASGGVIYASSSTAMAGSSAGSVGQVLISAGAASPVWVNQTSLSVGSAITASTANSAQNAFTATIADNALMLDSKESSDEAIAGTIVERSVTNQVLAGQFVQTSPNNENGTVSQVIVTNGSDNVFRKSSVTNVFQSFIGSPNSWNSLQRFVSAGSTVGSVSVANGIQAFSAAASALMSFSTNGTTVLNAGVDLDGAFRIGGGTDGVGTYRLQLLNDGSLYTRGNIFVNNNVVLTSSNFTTYAPSLIGGGATGTWNINISGQAAQANGVPWTGVGGRPTLLSQFTNDIGAVGGVAAWSTLTGTPPNVSIFNNDAGYANAAVIADLAERDGTNATGTWPISVTGAAGSVTWANVIGKPDTLADIANVYVVAKNGDDTLGNGSFNSPFLTIQKAHDTATLDVADTQGIVIMLMPGTYTEPVAFTRPRTAVKGLGGWEFSSIIAAPIAIDPSSLQGGDANNSSFGFEDVFFSVGGGLDALTLGGATYPAGLNLTRVRFYTAGGKAVVISNTAPGSNLNRFRWVDVDANTKLGNAISFELGNCYGTAREISTDSGTAVSIKVNSGLAVFTDTVVESSGTHVAEVGSGGTLSLRDVTITGSGVDGDGVRLASGATLLASEVAFALATNLNTGFAIKGVVTSILSYGLLSFFNPNPANPNNNRISAAITSIPGTLTPTFV